MLTFDKVYHSQHEYEKSKSNVFDSFPPPSGFNHALLLNLTLISLSLLPTHSHLNIPPALPITLISLDLCQLCALSPKLCRLHVLVLNHVLALVQIRHRRSPQKLPSNWSKRSSRKLSCPSNCCLRARKRTTIYSEPLRRYLGVCDRLGESPV